MLGLQKLLSALLLLTRFDSRKQLSEMHESKKNCILRAIEHIKRNLYHYIGKDLHTFQCSCTHYTGTQKTINNNVISQTTQTFQTMVYNITQKEKVIVPRHSKNLGPGYNHAAHYTQNKARAHYCCSSTMV